MEVTQRRDDQYPADGEPQPRDVHSHNGVHGVVGEIREAADQRALEHDVGERGERAAGHAPYLTEAVGDEAVEGACRGDVPGHRDVADREQRQDDRREEEACGCTDTVAEAHRYRGVARHRGDRRGVGDGHEEDGDDADRALLQSGRRWRDFLSVAADSVVIAALPFGLQCMGVRDVAVPAVSVALPGRLTTRTEELSRETAGRSRSDGYARSVRSLGDGGCAAIRPRCPRSASAADVLRRSLCAYWVFGDGSSSSLVGGFFDVVRRLRRRPRFGLDAWVPRRSSALRRCPLPRSRFGRRSSASEGSRLERRRRRRHHQDGHVRPTRRPVAAAAGARAAAVGRDGSCTGFCHVGAPKTVPKARDSSNCSGTVSDALRSSSRVISPRPIRSCSTLHPLRRPPAVVAEQLHDRRAPGTCGQRSRRAAAR